MLVTDLLKKENNNIDLLRLIAALAVIYGHAYAITPQPPLIDFVGARVSGEYSGSIAVKFFFFLSGLVVTNSLIRNPSLFNFLVARATRLVPALLVCLAITAFAVAPLFSILPPEEYYSDRLPYRYFWRGLTFRPEWALPGVFAANPMTAVNGSLWTLPIEANCYLMLFAMAALQAFRTRMIGSLVTLGVMFFLTLVYGGMIAGFSAPKTEATLLQLYFLAGGLCCLVGHFIDVSIWTVVGLAAVAYLSKGTTIFPSLQTVVILIAGLWLSTTTTLKAFRLPGDYSYGVYLYGFFVQQCLKAAFPLLDLRWHQLLCMLIALACGAASWHLLERPAMLIWRRRAERRALAR